MSKMFGFLLAVGIVSIAGVHAQQPPVNPNAPANPAISTPGPTVPATPGPTVPATTGTTMPAAVPGANSFTEGQAKSRLESDGFSAVTGLKKDDDGIWRAMATKGGQSKNVSVDYQGNIVVR